MAEQDPLRVAVVGFGLAGSAFHAPVIAATPGARVAAIVARSAQPAARAARAYPEAEVVPAVADLPDVGTDAAVVATPNDTHVDVALQLLELGIPVVVDKPLAPTAAAAEGLVARAAELSVPLTCYQNRRWDGDYRTVVSLRDAGELGRIHRFESRFERWRPQVKPGWKEVPGPGAGVLYDLGPHVVDQAIQLLGPVADVYAEVRTVRPGALVPDDAFLALTHESGAVSHLWTGALAGAPGPRFRVLGTAAAYVKDGMDPQEDALRAGQRPDSPDWGTESPEHWGRLRTGTGSHEVPTLAGDYTQFYRSLVSALRDGAALPVDPRESVRALAILDQAAGLA